MIANAQRPFGSGFARTEIARPFDRYKKEPPQDVRQADIKKNEALPELKSVWAKFIYDGFPEKTYRNVLQLIKGINYPAEDITKFSIALVEFQEEKDFAQKAGIFLSALINNSADSDFIVITKHLDATVDWMCFRNTKNVTIDGDVDCGFGNKMTAGKVIVTGSSDIFPTPDDGPTGGEIHIYGELYQPQRTRGAKLYHKGVLVYPEVDKNEA